MNKDRKQFVRDVAEEMNRGKLLHCHNCFCQTDTERHKADHEFIHRVQQILGRFDQIRWNMINLIISAIVLATLAALGFDSLIQHIK